MQGYPNASPAMPSGAVSNCTYDHCAAPVRANMNATPVAVLGSGAPTAIHEPFPLMPRPSPNWLACAVPAGALMTVSNDIVADGASLVRSYTYTLPTLVLGVVAAALTASSEPSLDS